MLCDRSDGRGIRQHAGFHRRDGKILKHRVHLEGERMRINRQAGEHITGILGRDCGDNRTPPYAKDGECLEICLNPGSSAGVRTGNRTGAGYLRSRHLRSI